MEGEFFANPKVRFTVFGNTNAGKSTTINRLLGLQLLGVNAERETVNYTSI